MALYVSLYNHRMFHVDPSQDLERFQKPSMPLRAQTFGFQGYPEGRMEHYKPPIRVQPSADVTRDVDRYFRRGKMYHLGDGKCTLDWFSISPCNIYLSKICEQNKKKSDFDVYDTVAPDQNF